MWGTSSESESELVISPSKKDQDEGDECGEHPVKVKVNMLSHHPRRIGTNEMNVGKEDFSEDFREDYLTIQEGSGRRR